MKADKAIKLTAKQKEVIKALRDGCRIYISDAIRPGNVGHYRRLRYTNGKGLGGSVPISTMSVLCSLKLIDASLDGFKVKYTLSKKGQTIQID